MTENFLRLRPLERWEMPVLENTCLFPLKIYKQSGSEKISIAIKIDKISLRIIKHQEKHLENEQKRFPVKKNCYYLGVYYPMLC